MRNRSSCRRGRKTVYKEIYRSFIKLTFANRAGNLETQGIKEKIKLEYKSTEYTRNIIEFYRLIFGLGIEKDLHTRFC